MSNPWFRMYSEAIDDEKLRLVSFDDRWHFVALLCCKNMGILDDLSVITRRKIAVKMGVDIRELGEIARRLSEVGLIDQDTLQPKKWDERQFRSDSSTQRVKEYRERLKPSDNQARNTVKRFSNVTVTAQDTDTEEDTDKETKKKTDLPDWLPRTLLEDFKDHRKKMKKPFTEAAESLFVRKLISLKEKGFDAVECLETALLNGWLTVYEPKNVMPITVNKNQYSD